MEASGRYKRFMTYARSIHGEGWFEYQPFQTACRKYAEDRLDCKVLDNQFEILFQRAWDQGHSNGYGEVAMIFDDLLDIVERFVPKDV